MTDQVIPPESRRKWAVPLVLLAILVWFLWPSSPHFVGKDVTNIETSIREEFTKRDGVKVVEVTMIKESDRKLSGFAKLEIDGLKELAKLFGNTSSSLVTRSCTATMGDKWEIIWQCQ